MRLIDINEALQAVDNRINELNKMEVFRKKADIIDVLGVKKWINNIAPIEAIPKDQYEARLKADMVAMLEELQKEVNELHIDYPMAEYDEDMNRGIEKAADFIQQKINALKGNDIGGK